MSLSHAKQRFGEDFLFGKWFCPQNAFYAFSPFLFHAEYIWWIALWEMSVIECMLLLWECWLTTRFLPVFFWCFSVIQSRPTRKIVLINFGWEYGPQLLWARAENWEFETQKTGNWNRLKKLKISSFCISQEHFAIERCIDLQKIMQWFELEETWSKIIQNKTGY